jgi:hypothetical protein
MVSRIIVSSAEEGTNNDRAHQDGMSLINVNKVLTAEH